MCEKFLRDSRKPRCREYFSPGQVLVLWLNYNTGVEEVWTLKLVAASQLISVISWIKVIVNKIWVTVTRTEWNHLTLAELCSEISESSETESTQLTISNVGWEYWYRMNSLKFLKINRDISETEWTSLISSKSKWDINSLDTLKLWWDGSAIK